MYCRCKKEVQKKPRNFAGRKHRLLELISFQSASGRTLRVSWMSYRYIRLFNPTRPSKSKKVYEAHRRSFQQLPAENMESPLKRHIGEFDASLQECFTWAFYIQKPPVPKVIKWFVPILTSLNDATQEMKRECLEQKLTFQRKTYIMCPKYIGRAINTSTYTCLLDFSNVLLTSKTDTFIATTCTKSEFPAQIMAA